MPFELPRRVGMHGSQRLTARALVALAVALLISPFGQVSLSRDSTTVSAVRPGVIHKTLYRSEGPWVINVLEIDLLQPDLRIESAKGLDRVVGREPTSSVASRKNDSLVAVVAALNADFFEENGETVSGEIANGVYVRGLAPRGPQEGKPSWIRSQFGMTRRGRPVIERFEFSGTAFWKNGSRSKLGCVNVLRGQCGIALFNIYFGPSTPVDSLAHGAKEVPLSPVGERNDTLLYIVNRYASVGGGVPIPENGIVLRTSSQSPVFDPAVMAPRDTVKIVTQMLPDDGPLRTLVGGTPRIVLDGKNVAGREEFSEGTSPEFSSKRHPRTGVGFSGDSTTVYWITVDGRQSSSVGMSLPEFADLMIALGVHEGLNLDGGGSTTMVVEGHVVNSPSDATGERPVGNCVLLLAHRNN